MKFRIEVGDDVLADLHARLRNARWPDRAPGPGYGFDFDALRELVDYWLTEYDWRAEERRLNELPHFVTEIRGHRIHYIHQRGRGAHPMPLILTHGWPGSFVEMTKVLPLLTDFNVVVPSLPGFGFSSRPTEPGMSPWAAAELLGDLMRSLGYDRYGAQGGDFGAGVATRLAWKRPEEIIGIHLNYIPGSYRPFAPDLTDEERAFLAEDDAWLESEGAYAHLQRTTPQTPAYALNDSPIGLAAWILEKFALWADQPIGRDELLTNVMIYWVTGTIGSSMRLYLEAGQARFVFGEGERITPPCGIARFPKEAPFPPRSFIERVYDVVHWTDMPRGGHFAAMEEPELLAEDVRAFFASIV